MPKPKQYCSIMNYIKHNDKLLEGVIQDLCAPRWFIPNRTRPGITFLHPDTKLVKELRSMVDGSGDAPVKAAAAVQSLIIVDYLPTLDSFIAKKKDIPTYFRKKLPVGEKKGKAITVGKKGLIQEVPAFKAREDRPNMAVYKLTGELIPTDTPDATYELLNQKTVKGGKVMAAQRKDLFQEVLKKYCQELSSHTNGPTSNSAMEILVNLCAFLKTTGNDDVLKGVCSQLSRDPMTSLAIILGPGINNDAKQLVQNSVFNEWIKNNNETHSVLHTSRDHFASISFLLENKNPCSEYVSYHNKSRKHIAGLAEKIRQFSKVLLETTSRPTVVSSVNDIYKKLMNLQGELEPKLGRRATIIENDPERIWAEGELRVFAAVVQSNWLSSKRQGNLLKELSELYLDKCTLNKSYMIKEAPNGNIAYYYSSIYLMLRSTALFYIPGLHTKDDRGLDAIADPTVSYINIDKQIGDVMHLLRDSYEKRLGQFNKLVDARVTKQKKQQYHQQEMEEKQPIEV